MKKINEDLFLFVNHDFYGSGGYYIWYATAMLFWTSASCFGLFSITFIINTMTKVMLNLENSFFKFLQEILARSFINAVFAFCSRHLKVWRVPVPFMWNTTESSWAWKKYFHVVSLTNVTLTYWNFLAWEWCLNSLHREVRIHCRERHQERDCCRKPACEGVVALPQCCAVLQPPASQSSYWAGLYPCLNTKTTTTNLR